MTTLKFLMILLALSINLRCFYISKQPIPTLFLNQQFRFNINHNAGDNINFLLVSGPSFLTLRPNGQLRFTPKSQGSFQAIIQAINASTNANLITLSYVITVLDKSKQLRKPLWILDQENYFTQINSQAITKISTQAIQIFADSFDFHSPIMTNQNIRLKLNTKNEIGPVLWFYENLPSTMMGNRASGLVQGYVETQGNYIIEVTAIDSSFKLGQIYLFLKFNQTPLSLQQDSYSQYNWRSAFIVQQKQQNAKLLENEIKNLINTKNSFKSRRNEVLTAFKATTGLRQQNKSIQDGFTQRIKLKNDELQTQQRQRLRIQTDLNNQKAQVDQSRKSLSDRQREYASKVEESKKINSTQQNIVNDLKQTRVEFDSIKNQVSQLQNQIYLQENDIRNIQFQRSRTNVTYITYQRQEIRTRQILEIRKNIEFQYLIKKAQTDNKVRSIEDYVFLAQTNYDFAYSEYKRLSLLYIQHVIEGSFLQSQIQLALKDYDYMNKTLNAVKLNYAIAEGSVNTLKVAKEQLSKLSAYALNSEINSTSSMLTETQMIQAQVKLQTREYPFTGCQKIGNFAWAGSGKIKTIGRNWIGFGSEETLNFGACTNLKTNIKGPANLQVGQWVQFSGYFWDGTIQATSITILSLN